MAGDVHDAGATAPPIDADHIVVSTEQPAFHHARHNVAKVHDVDADGLVTPVDALLVINHLNSHADPNGLLPGINSEDVSGDDAITPLDALLVINWLNSAAQQSAHLDQVPPENHAPPVEPPAEQSTTTDHPPIAPPPVHIPPVDHALPMDPPAVDPPVEHTPPTDHRAR